MGSKYRLLPWIGEALAALPFESALDAFSGSGCVSYMLKCMGKQVVSNDCLNFAYQSSLATIENAHGRREAKRARRLEDVTPKGAV